MINQLMTSISTFQQKYFRPIFLLILLLLNQISLQAQGIDETINTALRPLSDGLNSFIFYSVTIFGAEVPLIVLWLVSAAIFFTFYFNFLNFTGFKHAISLVKGDYDSGKDEGEVSHFQALATALSGTVGILSLIHISEPTRPY